MPQWTVDKPEHITIDEPVNTVRVGLVSGAINVVGGADAPVRLEVTEHEGDPLQVSLVDGVLTVGYPELSWTDFLEKLSGVVSIKYFLSARRRKRRSAVSIAVPSWTDVKIGTVNADSTVSGIEGQVSVSTANGESTLVRVAGHIHASSVSGNVDAQAVTGELKLSTVSGDVAVVAGKAERIIANTVSGSVILDLDTDNPTEIKVNTVNGDVGVRLPSKADATVLVGSTSGDVTSTFDQLRVAGSWGWRRLSGRLGSGTGELAVNTVSGAVTIQRRPEPDDERPIEPEPETLEDF